MENAKQSFSSQLWERRIFQIVGSYLIGAWAFVQFTDWVVDRYGLASGWTEFVIIFLIVLLPSVVMLTWYHGKPGPDQWRKIEKIFIPANVLCAGLIAFFSFPSDGYATQIQKVMIPTEEGDTIVRNIPTLAFQERIVVFQSKSKGLDEDNEWVTNGLSELVVRKLEQDMRITALGGNAMKDEIADYGFKDNQNIPMNIYRTAAEDVYANHFLITELSGEENDLEMIYSMHESKTGREKKSGFFKGSIYEIADFLHDEVRSSIFLSDFVSTEDYVNLGSTALITPNIAALKAYIIGINMLSINAGSQEGFQSLMESTKIDSTCSECFAKSAKFGFALMGVDFKKKQIEKALLYYKALPERQQLDIKYWKYFPEDFPRAYDLCKMWRQLYPMDGKPYMRAMDLKSKQLHVDEAISIGEEALKNGHVGAMYLSLARLYTLQGNIEKSNEYLKSFAADHPQKAKTVSEVGLVYLYEGETEKGLEFFKSKVLLDPEKPKNHLELASAYSVAGDLDNMLNSYQEALAVSRSVEDSITSYQTMELMYGQLGRFIKFEEYLNKRKQLTAKVAPPIAAAVPDIFPYIISFHKKVNKEGTIKDRLDQFIKNFSNPAYDFRCAVNINYFIGIENGDSLSYYLTECRESISQSDGGEIIILADGVAALAQGKYAQAIEKLELYSKTTGLPSYNLAALFAQAYLKNGELIKAEELLTKSLSLATIDPGNLFLLAQVQKEQGAMKKAKESAEKALIFWKEADEDFVPKQELVVFMNTL